MSGATWHDTVPPPSPEPPPVNGGSQRWPTTINGDGQPSDHQSTVVDRQSTGRSWSGLGPGQVGSWAGSGRVLGRVWIGSGLGPPRGMPRGATCQPAWQLTWCGGDYNPPAFRTPDLL
ncbi:hypothetical protein Tco_0460197, partial [Tanacetum coccineum]